MKNLLMIIPFFPPNAGGGVHRPLGFVKNLERYGWRPTVIAPREDAYWIMDRSLLREVPSTCEVVRTGSLSGQFFLSLLRGRGTSDRRSQVRSSGGFALLRRSGALFLLPDTYVGWYPFAVRQGRRMIDSGRFDAIYSTSPPETSHLVARRLHELSGLPWVADFRDPWMNLHLLPPPTAFHAWFHRRLERRVCRDASVVVTNKWHKRMLEEKYDDAKSIELIPNGYDHRKLEAYLAGDPPRDEFQILHAGMLTQKRSAVPFLRGLRIFLDRCEGARAICRVVFVGPRESENDAEVARHDLTDVVEFRDTVSHAESLQLQRRSHILLLIKHLDPVYAGIVPGKLYEYMGMRRPILALVPDGEVKDIVCRLNRGEVAPLDNENHIADCIERIYRSYRDDRTDQVYDLSEVVEFQRERQAGDLASLLDKIVEGRG